MIVTLRQQFSTFAHGCADQGEERRRSDEDSEAVAAVREALGDQGFGALTEIDLKASLKEKLDVDVDPQTILGACRPLLAYEAIQAEPSTPVVLPCTAVVLAMDHETTLV